MSAPFDPIGNYELLRRLDAGGSVEFFHARTFAHPLEHRLLIRFPPGEVRWPPWARPEVAKHIVHPNVLQLHEVLTVDDRVVCVLEWLPGIDLRQLEVGARLPPGLAAFIVLEVCRGLVGGLDAITPGGEPLHATLGTMSPRSVRISVQGEVKVGYFGLGRLKPESAISTSLDERVLFLCPDLRQQGGDETPMYDVFHAGALLQWLLSGVPVAIVGATVEDSVRSVMTFEGRSFVRPDLSVSQELAAVLERMLARGPGDRFPSAHQAVAALGIVPEVVEVAAHARQSLAALVAH